MDTRNLYGLILCGGKSSRMGTDKYMINYHGLPQWLHLYSLLEPLCNKTFLSCNADQSAKISNEYNKLVDAPAYANIGPMAALLTAFDVHQHKDLLVVACDYPLIDEIELKRFIEFVHPSYVAASFYNETLHMYQPVLAWYSAASAPSIRAKFLKKAYSLMHFLLEENAAKYLPVNPFVMQSIDTPEDSINLMERISSNAKSNII